MACSCGDPNCNGAPDRDQIAHYIKEQGALLILVGPSEDQAPFLYTIGRTERGRPEFFVELEPDDDPTAIAQMVNHLVKQEVEPGAAILSADGSRVYMVSEPEPDEAKQLHDDRVIQADHYYGTEVDVLGLLRIDITHAIPPGGIVH